MKLPWTKWFPREWLSEKAAVKASLAARGLWREALDVMISNDTYMLEATSRPELAALLRCRVEELNAALPNLKDSCLGDVTLGSNGSVTLLSRRLQREWLARENGRKRVARYRLKRPCNENVPSVSVSASPPIGIGDRGKGRNLAPQLRTEIGKHFNRKPDDRWAYDEEFALVEVCKRPSAESEWLEILRFRKAAAKNGDRIREKLIATLENWPAELDRARNYKLSGASSVKIQSAKEYLDGAPAIVPVSDQTKSEWDKMKETLK